MCHPRQKRSIADAAGGIRGRSFEVVADDQQAARPDKLAALREKPLRRRSVHERLDRVCEIGALHPGWQVVEIAFDTCDSVRQSRKPDALRGKAGLDRAQRDALFR